MLVGVQFSPSTIILLLTDSEPDIVELATDPRGLDMANESSIKCQSLNDSLNWFQVHRSGDLRGTMDGLTFVLTEQQLDLTMIYWRTHSNQTHRPTGRMTQMQTLTQTYHRPVEAYTKRTIEKGITMQNRKRTEHHDGRREESEWWREESLVCLQSWVEWGRGDCKWRSDDIEMRFGGWANWRRSFGQVEPRTNGYKIRAINRQKDGQTVGRRTDRRTGKRTWMRHAG